MEQIVDKNYKTVLNIEGLKELYQELAAAEVVALDTETTGLNTRKDKIIGASFTTKVGNGFYFPVMQYNKDIDDFSQFFIGGESNRYWLTNLFKLLKGKKLITHNGAFDTTIIMYDYGIDLLEDLWIENMLIVHTVQEEGAFSFGQPFALKAIAKMYQNEIGIDVDTEANKEQIDLKKIIAENGGSTTKINYEIYKASFHTLARYACADTDLTMRIALLFTKKLLDEGLEKFFFEDEVMPVYREVTVPMERRGIKLDLDLINRTQKEIEVEMSRLKEEIVSSILQIESAQDWIVTQAFCKKYPPKASGKFGQKFVEMFELPLKKSKKGTYSLNRKAIEVLPESIYKKFLLDPKGDHGVDEVELLKVSIALWQEENDGELINIQSPNHLGDIAFNFMKLKPLSQTKKGKDQFNDDFIASISDQFEWAEKLRVYKKLGKISSTYVDRLIREEQDGIFYPYFKQHGTVSGRYGSNLQQLPKPKEDDEGNPIVIEYNNRVRAFFIAREGYKFIDSDYESLEPHIFASISNDQNLQEIFDKGHDFYSTVAIRTEKLQDVSPDKKAPNYLKNVSPSKRNKAKAYSLGIAYGMSDYALAMTLGVPTKEGKKLRDAYLEGFPGVHAWLIRSRQFFRENGYINNKLGRVRHLWRGKGTYDKYGESIMDYKFRKELAREIGQTKVHEEYMNYRNGLNSCLNFQIQSLAASVVNRAALAINRAIKANGWDGGVIAQIHDQLITEIREDQAKACSLLVQNLMENTTKLDGITLKAPPEIACNFLEGHV